MLHLIRNDMNIPFVRFRWVGFIFSAALVSLGLVAAVQIARGQARLGVDFAGGTAIEVEFAQVVTADALRAAAKDPQLDEVTLQNINDPAHCRYMLRVFAPKVPTEKVSVLVRDTLTKNLPGNTVTVLSSEDVGPAVSAHLREQALMAMFWAMVGILIYIWWRFDFRFAVGATVATVHDILAVLGIFFLMGYEVNLILITALLTIGGYSLNDTVVVFDRIRENLRLHRKDDFTKLVNDSINETLSRTIITSMCTLMVVLAMFVLGGEVIHSFSLAMLMGIIVGTYSSIYIASNILVEWQIRQPSPH
jgi:preprotein translocase subunit SecF